MDKNLICDSWGDLVKSIDAERRTLPWGPNDFSPSLTMSLAERKLRERDVDPIAMVYRDPVRENNCLSMQSLSDMNIISRNQELSKKKFNVINHNGPQRRIDSDPLFAAARKSKERGRAWHLLSHLKHDVHAKVPIQYTEGDGLELQKKFPAPPQKGRDPGRDFCIVNGKFKDDDSAKQEKIELLLKENCEKKYWKTHDYDFIKVKSYDPRQQEQFLRENKALEKTQGVAQAARYPHSLSHSEGQTYNILNHVILDSERLTNGPMHNDILALNRIKTQQMDNTFHTTGDLNALKAEEKGLKRITFKRWENEFNRGYNMLNNSPLKLVTPVDHPATGRPPSTWKKLQHTTNQEIPRTTIIENNFLGTHTGTGMNIHRAFTSFPSTRNGIDLSNNKGSDAEYQGVADAPLSRAATASYYQGSPRISNSRGRNEELISSNASQRDASSRCDTNLTPNNPGVRSSSGGTPRVAPKVPTVFGPFDTSSPSVRNRTQSVPILSIGRTESPMISVRTGGLSVRSSGMSVRTGGISAM